MFFTSCKHSWEVLTETVTESQFEHAMKQVRVSSPNNITIPHQMCDARRKHILVLTCTRCGKINRFVEDI